MSDLALGATPAAHRGTLTLARRVVEKAAAQAALETGVVGGQSGGLLGIGRQIDLDHRPGVEISLSADSVAVTLRVSVGYPMSLRTVAQRVREHVWVRLEQLTGMTVTRVDVDVVAVGTRDESERGLR